MNHNSFQSQLAAAKGAPAKAAPAKTPTAPVYSKTPVVEINTVTFLNGSAVESYSTDELVEIVRSLEARRAELEGIKAESGKIKEMVKAIDEDIKQVIGFIDERD
ncbi:hypothetical protein [Pseudoalteromonas sp. GB43]